MDTEKEIQIIKERNLRVELDKAWETSWTRRVFISVATYIVAGIWLMLINDKYPWLKSFVPAAGYMLSTLSLSFFRSRWQKNHN
ncbi:MAG TPA: hypothetical protein VJL32_01250 [Candidatus Paceibacterota bacterium]